MSFSQKKTFAHLDRVYIARVYKHPCLVGFGMAIGSETSRCWAEVRDFGTFLKNATNTDEDAQGNADIPAGLCRHRDLRNIYRRWFSP